MHYGGPIAQRYEKREVNDMGNSNNFIIFIEDDLISGVLK